MIEGTGQLNRLLRRKSLISTMEGKTSVLLLKHFCLLRRSFTERLAICRDPPFEINLVCTKKATKMAFDHEGKSG